MNGAPSFDGCLRTICRSGKCAASMAAENCANAQKILLVDVMTRLRPNLFSARSAIFCDLLKVTIFRQKQPGHWAEVVCHFHLVLLSCFYISHLFSIFRNDRCKGNVFLCKLCPDVQEIAESLRRFNISARQNALSQRVKHYDARHSAFSFCASIITRDIVLSPFAASIMTRDIVLPPIAQAS